ncbi:MAG: V-type ATP synthase subunit K [Treponema sp.]|jgi:V/A-type H+-transporting ATPase subunit K|nr:V-type ATP synthase subunit K [Treponema sp.]
MNIGLIGVAACLGLAALGSVLGAGVAGMSAIGAWKKCFIQNKPVPFILVAFAGAPLTQTIYGFILMNTLVGLDNPSAQLCIGVFAGLAMGASALYQGKCSAHASDAYGETGQGFGNYILVVGLIETVALFVMVFSLGLAGNL